MLKFRKTNDTISRKCLDRRTKGQKDEQRVDRPYYIEPFWVLPRVQKNNELNAVIKIKNDYSTFLWQYINAYLRIFLNLEATFKIEPNTVSFTKP